MYLGSYMYCATFSPPASLQSAPATRPLKSKNRRPASRSVQNALPRPRARARIGSRPAHPISLASRWREERAARSRQQPGPRLAVVRYPLPFIQLLSSLRFLYVFGYISWAYIASPCLSFQTTSAICH
jgi:hypothetical protein